MEICNLMAIQRDDGLVSITFNTLPDNNFHQIFMTLKAFDKVVGYDSDNILRLANYIYSLMN